jgi:hypothetical protein
MPNPENLVGKGFETHPEHINKTGLNRGRTMKSIFDEILALEAKGKVLEAPEVIQLSEELGRKLTYKEAFIIRTMAKALSSAERLADRTEGKPPQAIDITTDGEKLTNILKVEIVPLAGESKPALREGDHEPE